MTQDDKFTMRPPCSASNSILEPDLELAAKHNIIDQLEVLETDDGFYLLATFADHGEVLKQSRGQGLPEWFYILAQLLSEPNKQWYLTTRRDRDSPRLFKDLKRLNEHLKDKYPLNSFTLHRHVKIAGAGPEKKPQTRGRRPKDKIEAAKHMQA